MRYKMAKISNLLSPDTFFQAQNAPKSVIGSAPDPAGGAYDAPPDPALSRLGRGIPQVTLGIPPPHFPPRSSPSASRFSGLMNEPTNQQTRPIVIHPGGVELQSKLKPNKVLDENSSLSCGPSSAKTATYGITQCYLRPDTSESAPL